MSDSEYVINCPRCDSGKSPKLYVNPTKAMFNCFRCGWHGRLSELYKYPEIISSLQDKISLSEFTKLKSFKPLTVKNVDALEDLNPVREISFEDAQYSYLVSRGWSEELIFIYRPLVSLNPAYLDRVILPVIREDKIVYWTARSIKSDGSMKYKNPSIPRKDIIFESKLSENKFFPDSLVICEGIFDACSIPNAVALFGKTITKENETNLLQKLMGKSKVYVALDFGAESWIQTICNKLHNWMPNKEVYYIDTSKYKDNDLGKLAETLSSFDLMAWIQTNSIRYMPQSTMETLKSRLKLYN